jgi:shikimate dehydrogenase
MSVTLVNARSPVFCVLGHPVGHSLSPAMQNRALEAMGLDGVYVAFDVAPKQLAEAVRGLAALGVRGANVTIPHKEAILPLLDRLTPEAALIGAVNTVVPEGGALVGHNTDAPGFLQALRAAGGEPAGARVLVLGAGGSARAVGVALARAGASLTVANRTASRGAPLAARARQLCRERGLEPAGSGGSKRGCRYSGQHDLTGVVPRRHGDAGAAARCPAARAARDGPDL